MIDMGQGNQPGMVAVFDEVHDGKANGTDGTTGQVFQGGSVNFTIPQAGGGTQTSNFFIACDFFRPPGVAC